MGSLLNQPITRKLRNKISICHKEIQSITKDVWMKSHLSKKDALGLCDIGEYLLILTNGKQPFTKT